MDIISKETYGQLQNLLRSKQAIIYGVAASPILLNGLLGTLVSIQQLLMQIGPILSAVLFIIAGIMYSLGQLMPPDKRAQFHSTSINIIIGAVIVAILSVTSNSLAIASTHLLTNLTTINAT
jgi:hypothetical protein